MSLIQFLSSPIGATVLGAVAKMVANRMNAAAKKDETNGKNDAKSLEVFARMQEITAKDTFAKNTRRWVFWPLVWAYCFVFVFYAVNGGEALPLVVDKKSGILSFFIGGVNQKVIETNSTFVVYSGIQLIHMIVGFYAIPSKIR